jgi:flagellar basal-body rod protein FlgG
MYVAASGMEAQEKLLDIIAQNLANASTRGYKKMKPVFRTLTPQQDEPSRVENPDEADPMKALAYPMMEYAATDFTQGSLVATGNMTDMAIEGDGFFEVTTPDGLRYTRRGTFTVDKDNYLATVEGYRINGTSGPISLKEGVDFSVDEGGNVFQEGQSVGKFKVVKFPAPYKLVREGEGYFSYSEQPVEQTNYRMVQGSLEQSNVSIIKDMTDLISALRAYEGHQKYIRSAEEMSTKAVTELGRV